MFWFAKRGIECQELPTLVDTLYLKRCYTEALAYKLVNWVLNLYRRLHNAALLSLVRRSKGLRCEGIRWLLKQEKDNTLKTGGHNLRAAI
jgi:hypothetical protein